MRAFTRALTAGIGVFIGASLVEFLFNNDSLHFSSSQLISLIGFGVIGVVLGFINPQRNQKKGASS